MEYSPLEVKFLNSMASFSFAYPELLQWHHHGNYKLKPPPTPFFFEGRVQSLVPQDFLRVSYWWTCVLLTIFCEWLRVCLLDVVGVS